MLRVKTLITALIMIMVTWTSHAAEEKAIMSNVTLKGDIDERNIEFTLKFEVDVKEKYAQIPIICGDIVLKELPVLPERCELSYDVAKKTYFLKFKYRKKHTFDFKFAARPEMLKDGWQATSFTGTYSRSQ